MTTMDNNEDIVGIQTSYLYLIVLLDRIDRICSSRRSCSNGEFMLTTINDSKRLTIDLLIENNTCLSDILSNANRINASFF